MKTKAQKRAGAMVAIVCPECGINALRRNGEVNRAKKLGVPIYCSKECAHRNRGKKLRKPPWRHRNNERRAGRPCPQQCEVCGSSESVGRNGKNRMHFDHNHTTGEFRGWICGSCNRILGLARDNPIRLESLARYLRRNLCRLAQ